MTKADIERQAIIDMAKWMIVQGDKSAPEFTSDWAYDAGMDSTWEIVGEALTYIGVFSASSGNSYPIEYKTLIHFKDLEVSLVRKDEDFRRVFLAFLTLGSFYGYIPKFSFHGFRVCKQVANTFHGLSELGFCFYKDDFWFWNSPVLLEYVKSSREYAYIRPISVECLNEIDPRDVEIMDKLKDTWREYPIVWRLHSIPSTRPWYI